jgi:zinc finger SWIM domain-containing protein 3
MENAIPICLPKVGKKFRNLDGAWSFWVNYRVYVEARKRSSLTTKMDGKVTSYIYVCAKRRRAQDKRDHLTKNPQAETRTCCEVHICLSLDRVAGHYEVLEVILCSITVFTCHISSFDVITKKDLRIASL